MYKRQIQLHIVQNGLRGSVIFGGMYPHQEGEVGMLGIRPTIAAIKAKKTIALANKETLVTAGHIIIPVSYTHLDVYKRQDIYKA